MFSIIEFMYVFSFIINCAADRGFHDIYTNQYSFTYINEDPPLPMAISNNDRVLVKTRIIRVGDSWQYAVEELNISYPIPNILSER